MICDHLSQVSLPHFEGGTLSRQPIEMVVVVFMHVAEAVGEHGKAILADNPKLAEASCGRSSAIVRRRSIALEPRDSIGISAVVVETVDQSRERLGQAVARQPRARLVYLLVKTNPGFTCRAISPVMISLASGGNGTVWILRAFIFAAGISQ